MKTYLLIILLLASFHGFSQKKGKSAPAPDPKDLKIDSLTKINGKITLQLDSVTKSSTLYLGVYTAVKEKVLLHDFDPAKTSQIIDSLKISKDATIKGLSGASASLSDSLTLLSKENSELKAKLNNKDALTAELKQLKDLLDSKIITQAEYDDKKKLVMDRWQ
jgi:Short C-terminal domain